MQPIELKALRKEYKRTQQDVAVAAGISVRQYQNYESGETPITDKVKDELIRAIHENKKKPKYLDHGSDPAIDVKSIKELQVEIIRLNATTQILMEAVAVLWGKDQGVTAFEALRGLHQKEKEWRESQIRE